MAVIGMRAEVKRLFFDRKAVVKAVDRKTRRYMARAGAFAMTTARRSMRPAPKPRPIDKAGMTAQQFAAAVKAERYRRASRPGQPPRVRSGLLKKNVFFAFDPPRGVVVGPTKLSAKAGSVPRVLEYGGQAVRRVKGGRRVRDTIAPRPYMAPALRETVPMLPKLYAEASKGG